MGQAWCKEKTSRAQDSKSPLDRVFVRCAHRIYPGLKEEGSVLGGATQRVTSSEIGYAGSPPRELLTRGRSIDSVDRPFHPSDWVDVNLEVPSTPRASSVLTNLTVDTCLYPATTPTSSCSNLKDTTPVPPPRRRKRNRGRPLPPKPDETVEKTNNKETRRVNGSEEPFYSSVSTPRLVDDYGKTTTTTKLNDEVDEDEEENEDDDENDDEDDDDNDDDNGNDRSEDVVQAKTTTMTTTKERKESCRIGDNPRPEGRRTKEIYEHKASVVSVNGTGRIISSDMVAGRRSVPINVGRKSDRRTRSREEEKEEEKKKEVEMEEEQHRYEKFVRGRTTKDTSTPNRRETKKKQDERKNSTTERSSKEEEEEEEKRDGITKGRNAITKNCSTVSLPSYHELDVTRRATRDAKDKDHDDHAVQQGTWEKMGSKGAVRSSTGSLPAESLLSPFSQKTSVRLEDYIPQRGSSENLSPYRETVKLDRRENGLDDGDGDSGGFLKYDPSKLEDWDFSDISNCESNHRRSPLEGATITEIGTVSGGSRSCGGIDDVDSPRNALENEAIEGKVSSYDVPRQPITLQKPESYGAKTASVEVGKDSRSSVNRNDHPIDQRGSSKHFEPSTAVEIDKPSGPPLCREPFFLNEEKHRSASDTIGGWCSGRDDVGDSDRSEPSRKRTIFERRLSNESEPYEDPCESKELGGARSDTQNIVGTSSSLIRTISEESLPREMLSEEVDVEVLEEKRKKFDAFDSSSKEVSSKEVSSRTPPPSPEVRIKAEVLDNDHSTLLKILKEETTEGSNFSSMTPSLTELEVALSDMLEKEDKMVDLETSKDKQETSREERKDDGPPEASSSSCLEERWRKDDEVAEGGQLLLLLLQEDGGERTKEGKGSLVVDEELPSKSSRETAETTRRPLDDRPEKPGRWRHISIEEMQEKALEKIPTPPRRRNRDSVATAVLKDSNRRSGMNGSTGVTESICNDRLI